MRPKVKYAVIYRHRNEYSVSVMCRFFEVSRSGYYDFVRRIGQQVHKYKNLLNRQFRTDRPNAKWVTDISYIHTKEGVLYLSIIRDLYDNSIRHNAVDVKERNSLRQRNGRKFLFYSENRMYLSAQTKYIQGSR